MFKGIVQRYAPNGDDDEAGQSRRRQFSDERGRHHARVRQVLPYIAFHSQPPETEGIRPTLDELKKDELAPV